MDANTYTMINKQFLPKDSLPYLNNKLKNINSNDYTFMFGVEFISPVTTLLFSIFLGMFGVDRFYQKNVKLGILKLLLCPFTLYIWWIVDIFFSSNSVRRDNFDKVCYACDLIEERNRQIEEKTKNSNI